MNQGIQQQHLQKSKHTYNYKTKSSTRTIDDYS